jgi:hypothetical protein
VPSNHQDQLSLFCLIHPQFWKFWTPPISETEPSGFAELGLAEHIVALCIGQKPNCLVWQTGTSDFFKNQMFLSSFENLMLVVPNCSPLYFHPWKHAAQ